MSLAYTINTQKVQINSINGKDVTTPEFRGTFSIESKLNQLGIKEGAKTIIIKPENKDFRFLSTGVISKVLDIITILPPEKGIMRKSLLGSPPPRVTYRHNFQVLINEKLKENNLLSELEYSLKDVYRYNNPSVHFHAQYKDLKEDDYETIAQGWVYTVRTVFGKLINSIPRQNKLEFMLQAMNQYSTIDFTKVSLQDGLEFLYDYIEKRILNKGLLLVETNKIIKEKFNDLLEPTEVGFIDPDSMEHNNISNQASYFEKLFILEKTHNLREYVQNTISNNMKLEMRFNEIFAKVTWPIDLRL